MQKAARHNESEAGTLLALPRSVVMSRVTASRSPIEILPPPLGSAEDRERRLIDAVVALARSLRDERDRLAARLREVELELSLLASRLAARGEAEDALGEAEDGLGEAVDGLGETADGLDPFRGRETADRAVRPRRPSRRSA